MGLAVYYFIIAFSGNIYLPSSIKLQHPLTGPNSQTEVGLSYEAHADPPKDGRPRTTHAPCLQNEFKTDATPGPLYRYII